MILHKNNYNPKKLSFLLSFCIVLALLLIGIIFQLFFGSVNATNLGFPYNLTVLFFIVLFITVGYFRFPKTSIVNYLTSTNAAISSIVGFSVISLLMGFIPQLPSKNYLLTSLGLNNIAYSYIYLFSLLFLVLSLGLATVKRIYPFRKANIWFILNHLGLWITLVAANFGFADQNHLRMDINTDHYNYFAFNEKGDFLMMPFGIKQNDFKLENYNPKLTIIDRRTSLLSINDGKNSVEVKVNNTETIGDWSINILRYYEFAQMIDKKVLPIDSIGVAPAAFVSAKNVLTKATKQGWISLGNNLLPELSLILDNEHSLVMLPPTEKTMNLNIGIQYGTKEMSKLIAINSPQTFDSWKIYLVSFDKSKDKWSKYAIVELVNDPWQPFVYLGLWMMIVGSFFVFWRGKK